jgi:hypothetical protein
MKNIKLSNFSNVYILSPYFQTGGPELLHQLCDALRMGGINACIVYVDANYKFFEASIIPAYQKYNVQTSVFIEDSRENVVVFPEIFFPISKRYERVQKLFWWLSVDNYFNSCSTFSFPYLKFIGFRQYLRNFKNKYRSLIKSHMSLNEGTMSLREIKNSLALNACQSFYAKTFLCKNGIENSVLLRDYINTEFVRTVHDNIKKNQILYNPKH